MNSIFIPVCDDLVVTEEFIEQHCAKTGYIVTNIRQAPAESFVMIGDQRMWNGDRGINFWIADVVATEMQNEYPDAPIVQMSLEEQNEFLEVEEWIRRMFDKDADD
jgi:hypothetical protein